MARAEGVKTASGVRGSAAAVRWRAAACLVVMALLAAGCTSGAGGGDDFEVAGHRLSEAEWLYGLAPPAEAPGLEYQDDVVLIEGGPEAVRGVSPDWLTWRIDGDADGADQLEPGRIMFATGLGMGEVLAVSDVDGDRAVTIGPVELTDVYEELDVSVEQPIAIEDFIAYTAPAYGDDSAYATIDQAYDSLVSDAASDAEPASDLSTTDDGTSLGGPPLGSVELVAASRPLAQSGLPVRPSKQLSTVPVGPFRVTPRCCNGGIGIRADYDVNGTILTANALLRFDTPRVTFNLRIGSGSVVSAKLALSGAAGLHFDFTGGSVNGLSANIVSPPLILPIEISFPVFLGVIPAYFSFDQVFKLATAFSAKNSTLSASGDYSIGGEIGFEFRPPYIGPLIPSGFSTQRSLLQSVDGVSVGINSFVWSYAAKASVGIGALGFKTGLWAQLSAGVTGTRGSDLGILVCNQATFDAFFAAGIGWSIPKPIADVVNFFLRVFQVKPIQAKGGTEFANTSIVHKEGRSPKVKLCLG